MSLLDTQSRTQMVLGQGRISAMAFHPTSNILFLSLGSRLQAWAMEGILGTHSWEVELPHQVRRLLVSQDGEHVYAATIEGIFRYSLDGTLLDTFQGTLSRPLAMVLLEKQQLLLVMEDKALSVWDTVTLERRWRTSLPAMAALGPAAIHPEGKCIAYAGQNDAIRVDVLMAGWEQAGG